MALATYISDLVDIFLFESTTGVAAYGGGGAGLGVGPDYAMEGTNAVDKQITNAEKGFLFAAGSAFTIGADDHFFVWVLGATPGLNDTRNNRGIIVGIGDDTSNFVKFHVDGVDTLPFGGGKPYAIRFVNTTLVNRRTLVGAPGTAPDNIGGGLNTTGTVKSPNLGVDAARIGTGYDVLNGTGADPEANFAGIEADDTSTSEGVLQPLGAGHGLQGKIRIGSSGTACEFLDSNVAISLLDTLHSLTDFTEILIENASSIVTLTNVSFTALGTNNVGRLEVITDAATLTFSGVSFIDFGVVILGSGSTLASCTWVGSGRIDLNEADISGSSVLTSSVAADEGAVFDDRTTTAATVLSEYNDCTFSMGANLHHAIRFGVNVNDDLTLTNVEFTGFDTVNDDQNDSMLRFDATAGSINLNLIGCTVDGAAATASNFTMDTLAGITVTPIFDPKTATFKVLDGRDNSNLQGANVLVESSDGTGDLPFEDVVTLTQTAGTVSVAHTAHGMASGNVVVIRDAVETEYNGPFVISNVTTNAYDYTIVGNPSSPATGTILASGAVVSGLTDANGEIADTRTWGADQPIKGKVRKSSKTPVFKAGAITDTISSATGLSNTTILVFDE